MSHPPQRVRVTAPRHGRPRRSTVIAEIDAQTVVGDIYIRSLMRSQLRLALAVVALLLLTVGALPLVFHTWPGVAEHRLAGVPLVWVALGAGCYPLLLALAALYVRRAERNERAFAELVSQEPPEGDR
jgi:sorbitol-specific phosphotransferase system component IIBC